MILFLFLLWRPETTQDATLTKFLVSAIAIHSVGLITMESRDGDLFVFVASLFEGFAEIWVRNEILVVVVVAVLAMSVGTCTPGFRWHCSFWDSGGSKRPATLVDN